MNPFEIVKRTPKSNCGQCGYPSCLAFSSAVSRGGESMERCPYLDPTGLVAEEPSGLGLDGLAEQRDLALIAHLKSKIAALDLSKIAAALGAKDYQDESGPGLSFPYLGQAVRISAIELLLNGNLPEDPRDQILLYNYVHSLGGTAPSLDWIGLESLPNSISKVRTLATYCEERLAVLFAQNDPQQIISACEQLGGKAIDNPQADLALLIPVLPRIPQYILYWRPAPEDGFAAKVKALFDRRVLDFLDLESLVFSAERLADHFAQRLGVRP